MTSTLSTSARPYDPLSISSLDFWAKSADEREQTFAQLRAERPVSWHRPLEGALMPPENDGVWVVVSHEHITEVSKHPELFCSGQGFQFEEIPEDLLSAAGSFLGMDDPRHAALRRLVSSAFTPKQVAKIHDQIKNQARLIVDGLIARKEGDFVEAVSKKLPMWTIYEMMGLEDLDQREEAAHHADGMVSWADEDVAAGREPGEVLNESLVGLLSLGFEFAEERRRNPKSDLMTGLVNAEVDGRSSPTRRSRRSSCCCRWQATTPPATRSASPPRPSRTSRHSVSCSWRISTGGSSRPSRSSCGGPRRS